MKHWRFGGSSAHRTINCPAWSRLADTLPPTPERVSEAANIGTALHGGFEVCMREPDEPLTDDEIATMAEIAGVSVERMADLIDEKLLPALDVLHWVHGGHDYELETSMEHPFYDDIGGTADLMVDMHGTFYVMDLKTGDGHKVVNVDQLKLYAYLAHLNGKMLRSTEVVLQYVQTYRGEVLTPEETITLDQLKDWGEQFEKKYRLQSSGADPVPGDHCLFCPAQSVCPAKDKVRIRAMDPKLSADLSEKLSMADELEAWISSVRSTAHKLLEQGQKVDGWKLVNKRAIRKWKCTLDAEKSIDTAGITEDTLVDMFTTSVLKSPAQIEKICKRESVDFDTLLGDYVVKVSSGTTLVKESDPRRPVLSASAFKSELAKR